MVSFQEQQALKALKTQLEIQQSERTIQIMDQQLAYNNRLNNVFQFRNVVDSDFLNALTERIAKWREIHPAPTFTISITSPGGSVFAGFGAIDLVREAINDGLMINTEIRGYAASMASAFAQTGSERRISAGSWLMIHEAGALREELMQLAQMRDQVEFLDHIQDQLYEVYAARSHLTVQDIAFKCYKYDWWIGASEALELGLVDKIVPARSMNMGVMEKVALKQGERG